MRGQERKSEKISTHRFYLWSITVSQQEKIPLFITMTKLVSFIHVYLSITKK